MVSFFALHERCCIPLALEELLIPTSVPCWSDITNSVFFIGLFTFNDDALCPSKGVFLAAYIAAKL